MESNKNNNSSLWPGIQAWARVTLLIIFILGQFGIVIVTRLLAEPSSFDGSPSITTDNMTTGAALVGGTMGIFVFLVMLTQLRKKRTCPPPLKKSAKIKLFLAFIGSYALIVPAIEGIIFPSGFTDGFMAGLGSVFFNLLFFILSFFSLVIIALIALVFYLLILYIFRTFRDMTHTKDNGRRAFDVWLMSAFIGGILVLMFGFAYGLLVQFSAPHTTLNTTILWIVCISAAFAGSGNVVLPIIKIITSIRRREYPSGHLWKSLVTGILLLFIAFSYINDMTHGDFSHHTVPIWLPLSS